MSSEGKSNCRQSVKVCCLADIPIGHLSYHAQRYGKFAIGFHRESAIKHEFSPVLYQLHDHFAMRWLYYGFDGLKQCYAIDLPQIVQDLRDAFERAANNGNAPTEDMQSQLYEIEGRANVINNQMSKAWEGMNTLLAFVKSFTQDEFGTIYTEREWRSVKPFNFAYDDVSMIVLPRNAGNGDHYKRFVDQAESIGAWFKNAHFRVTLRISARTLIGPARWSGFTRVPGCRAGASVPREPRVPQKFQPVSVRLTRQQLGRTLADSTGVVTAQVPAVIQEELKQRQVVLPQLPPQEEVAAQPAVEVLDQTAGPHNPIGELLHVGAHAVITPS